MVIEFIPIHTKGWHHYWYLALGAGVMALAAGVPYVVVHYSPFLSGHPDTAELILSAVLLVVFWGLSLPFIAPRFEHQADWFASRHMARVLARGEEEPPAANRAERPGAALQDMLAGAPTGAEAVTPSSPAVAILRDGKLVYLMQRFVIEQSTAEQIGAELVRAFDQFCATATA